MFGFVFKGVVYTSRADRKIFKIESFSYNCHVKSKKKKEFVFSRFTAGCIIPVVNDHESSE